MDIGPAYGPGSCGATVTAGWPVRVLSVGGSETYYGPYYLTLELLNPDGTSTGVEAILGHGTAMANAGQVCVAGTPLMAVNTYGASTGCHLHFEVRPVGLEYGWDNDPTSWLAGPVAPPAPVINEEDDMYRDLAPGEMWVAPVAPNTNFNFASWSGSFLHVDAYHPNGDPIGGKDYSVPSNLSTPSKGPVQAYDSAAGLGVSADGGTLAIHNRGSFPIVVWLHRE
jgi:murein DD-endopeptidase MepM/ murein hydrolase activator NlpD